MLKFVYGNTRSLVLEQRQIFEPGLLKYAHVFHDEETDYFKGSNIIEHQILLDDPRAQYRTPFALRYELYPQVENILKKDVTR